MFKLTKNLFSTSIVKKLHNAEPNVLQGTLHLRFLDYLKGNQNFRCDQQLEMMMNVFQEQPLPSYSKEFKSRFKQIDNKTLEIVNQKRNTDQQISALLNELIRTMPANVTNLTTFNEATRVLLRKFQKNPNRESFLKLCFYFGLYKKQSPGPTLLTELIDGHLEQMMDLKMTQMSTIDFAIICMATYKASVRINSKKFLDRVVQEICEPKEIDSQIFVSFIKSLRMNQINSPKVLEGMKRLRDSKELNKLDYKSLIHVFPLIADNGIVDENLSGFFVERCIETLSDESRAKDVQKLLYSCALLNVPVKLEHLKTLEKVVMERTEHKEFLQKFDNFVDVALSMWILNFRSRELIEKLSIDKRFSGFVANQNRVKIDSRKKLLETCVEIEEPSWFKIQEPTQPSFDQFRPAPRYLVKTSLEKAMMDFRAKDAKIVQQIRNLNIAGIVVKEENGNLVNIEVLDDTNSLSDKTSPNGIFALKLRLLKSKGCDVKVVSKFINFIYFSCDYYENLR